MAAALEDRTTTADDFIDGMRRFLMGLGKKVILANISGSILLECLPDGAVPVSVVGAWVSAIIYSLHLYFDFSAYSDMAIGLGRVLGFTYKENFNYPYFSISPTDLWHRWHISLGSFFREYVYFPLGGSRKGKRRQLLNLLIVWALTGLWHGAAWNYVLWGLYWYVLQIAHKAVEKPWARMPVFFQWLFNFVLTMIGMMVFYYNDQSALLVHVAAMFGGGVGWLDEGIAVVLRKYALFLPIACIGAAPIVPRLRKLAENRRWLAGLGTVFAVLVGLLSLLFLIRQSYNPFIYFRF